MRTRAATLTLTLLVLCCAVSYVAAVEDYYAILNVARTATQKEITKAYRTMAVTHHPDKSKAEDAHEKFIAINGAYDVLKDPKSREDYDLRLENFELFGEDIRRFTPDAYETRHKRYGPQKLEGTPAFIVLLVWGSVVQYIFHWMRYWHYQKLARKSERYKKAKRLADPNAGKPKQKKKNKRRNAPEPQEQEFEEPEVRVYGAGRPHPARLIIFRFWVLPVWIVRILRGWVNYYILKVPYALTDSVEEELLLDKLDYWAAKLDDRTIRRILVGMKTMQNTFIPHELLEDAGLGHLDPWMDESGSDDDDSEESES